MQYDIVLKKMSARHSNPVEYFMGDANEISCNQLIGKNIKLEFTGKIHCLHCGKITKKSFGQGYCYPCFISIPETEDCVLKPELCQAHLGIARDMEFAKEHCLIDHVVYIAFSSEFKVGITRISQVPTRWIDQGATAAIKIAIVPNRYTAGMVEVALKKHFTDKTNWRLMLTDKFSITPDFKQAIEIVSNQMPQEYQKYIIANQENYSFTYPVNKYPAKINSFDFDKNPVLEGVLSGIKGQYLIFENGNVINIRKFGGYRVLLSI